MALFIKNYANSSNDLISSTRSSKYLDRFDKIIKIDLRNQKLFAYYNWVFKYRTLGRSRPSIEDLMARSPSIALSIMTQQSQTDPERPFDSGKDNNVHEGLKLGWVKGVYIKCLLNIWGVMLFLRLTWVVGQAGLIEGLCIITLANVVTFITAISMSAVSTNGKIKGGGIYYMLSRSLGKQLIIKYSMR